MRRSTSAGVRCSRGRRSAFRLRAGGRRAGAGEEANFETVPILIAWHVLARSYICGRKRCGRLRLSTDCAKSGSFRLAPVGLHSIRDNRTVKPPHRNWQEQIIEPRLGPTSQKIHGETASATTPGASTSPNSVILDCASMALGVALGWNCDYKPQQDGQEIKLLFKPVTSNTGR